VGITLMKRFFQLLGLLVILGTITGWVLLGANRGWTKTSVPLTKVDEVTGIEAITYEKRFVPGVEILGAGIITGGVMLAISLFLDRKRT
jgi:hypothetical protein